MSRLPCPHTGQSVSPAWSWKRRAACRRSTRWRVLSARSPVLAATAWPAARNRSRPPRFRRGSAYRAGSAPVARAPPAVPGRQSRWRAPRPRRVLPPFLRSSAVARCGALVGRLWRAPRADVYVRHRRVHGRTWLTSVGRQAISRRRPEPRGRAAWRARHTAPTVRHRRADPVRRRTGSGATVPVGAPSRGRRSRRLAAASLSASTSSAR